VGDAGRDADFDAPQTQLRIVDQRRPDANYGLGILD